VLYKGGKHSVLFFIALFINYLLSYQYFQWGYFEMQEYSNCNYNCKLILFCMTLRTFGQRVVWICILFWKFLGNFLLYNLAYLIYIYIFWKIIKKKVFKNKFIFFFFFFYKVVNFFFIP